MGGICRDLNKLVPECKTKAELFLKECEKEGLDVEIIETYRTGLVQTAYYAQGRKNLNEVNVMRTGAGLKIITAEENKHIITNTTAGKSKHNLGEAFDVVPLVNGKPCWNNSVLFNKIGRIGVKCGLRWGGHFKSIKDSPHLEIGSVKTIMKKQKKS